MEACGSAHAWGRRLMKKGEQAKLVPPQFVAKQRVGNKNNSNDAEAIFAVHLDTRVKPMPVKSAIQQGQLAAHAARQQLVKSRTAMSNHLRSEYIKQQVIASPTAHRLLQARGIGPITASAAVAEYGDGVQQFSDARAFAANLCITPGAHSTGGKSKLGSLTKRGNAYLRKLLVQGANNLVTSACPKPNSKRALRQQEQPETMQKGDLHRFARELRARKPRKVVVIAVANRMARMIFAMLTSGFDYRAQRPQTTATSSA